MEDPQAPELVHRDRAEAWSEGLDRWSAEEWLAKVPAIPYVRRFDGASRPVAAKVVHVGSQVQPRLGYDADEFQSDPNLWTSRIHREDVGRILAAWRRTNETGGRCHLTYRMFTREGRLLHVVDEAEVVDEPGTGCSWWFGIVVDVTGDDPEGSALRDAEEKYRRLVEQVPTVIYVDEVSSEDPADLIPSYVSPQMERLLGFSAAEWIADPDLWDRSAHPDDVDAVNDEAARAYKAGEPLSIEYRMIARDGRVLWVREEATLVRDESGAPKFWQGVYVDITELKHSEERLQEALSRERDASEGLRALLISGLSFRTKVYSDAYDSGRQPTLFRDSIC